MNIPNSRQVIGITDTIDIIEAEANNVPIKVDTGAYYSSIWASDVKEFDGKLSFILFDKNSDLYSGRTIVVEDFKKSKIRNSFGHSQERYRVMLTIVVGHNKYQTEFTLANRSINKYPVLIGRSLLHNRFIVDVTKNNVHYNKAKQQ